MNTTKKMEWMGLPLYVWVVLVAITVAGLASGKMGTDFGSTIFWLTVFGAIIMGIGNQLPIVKDYLGGGPLLLLLLGSFATWAKLIPEAYVEATNNWMAGINFQAFFLTLLIISSVMAIDQKTLARSLIGYLPCIFGGLIGAGILAVLVGMLFFRLSLGDILMTYVMPIMGGGSAAGALPMSSIYEEVTGNSKDVYYGIAMSALMVANVLCIFFAVGLDLLGKKIPSLTGDGSQLLRTGKEPKTEKTQKETDVPCTLEDMGNGMMIMAGCWILAGLFSKWFLPKIFGVSIHQYAYLVVVAVVLNLSGVLSSKLRKGICKVYDVMKVWLTPSVFAGMAVSLLDFQSFIDALSAQTLILAASIIIGCIIGSAIAGYLVGFYPIDAAVTGGLCMANMGGSGDMLILSAGHRMELMTYASISSRIGGAIILAISGVIFGMFG